MGGLSRASGSDGNGGPPDTETPSPRRGEGVECGLGSLSDRNYFSSAGYFDETRFG
jgi:hypothetical protein